jgi:hypothetical protein
MDSSDHDASDPLIRITREEATSAHVDDLLRRQMSLRGEQGITRDRGRRWYYQNWFVFMIAGALGAVVAWAIIEPYFFDYLYTQGKIERIDADAAMPRRFSDGQKSFVIYDEAQGLLQLKGEDIWLLSQAVELRPDGSKGRVRIANLKAGDSIGLYVDYIPFADKDVAFAKFVVPFPGNQSAGEAQMKLSQLKARSNAAAILIFPLVAGLVGLAIGAVDGIVCRLFRRALVGGGVGLLVGFVGGFFSSFVANLVYAPLHALAMRQSDSLFVHLSTFAFVVQMTGRALAWTMAGLGMGLGMGISLRSTRLLLYGLLGGISGGLLGGLLFDPIDLILLGSDKPSAAWSRLIGFAVIGACVGAMIGVVELLARDAWLRMTQGPLAGKEFLIFKDVMNVGSSPRSDIYLFNDPAVSGLHARVRAVGTDCEIENLNESQPALLNGRPLRRARLRHGDQISIGRTIFVFQTRHG